MRTSTLHTAHPRAEISLLWLEYFMYALVVPSFIGAAISWFKSREYEVGGSRQNLQWTPEDLVIATHHEWLKRTFLWTVFFGMVAIGTSYYGVGYAVAAGTAVWWAYRVLRGIAALSNGRSLPLLL